jgi:hypothetical protein
VSHDTTFTHAPLVEHRTYWLRLLQWVYPRAILGASVCAVVAVLAGGASGRLGGDLPAFYGAGRIVLDGDTAHLYSHQRQHAAQLDLFPAAESHSYLYFAYPPFVALPCALLALLPFLVAYAVHVGGMAACLAAATRIAGRSLALPTESRHLALAMAVTFYPLFRAVSGGQNTALSLLAIVASAALLERRREFLAGLAMGVLWFKPQFAMTFVGLWVIERRPRAVLGALATAVVCYAAGAVLAGPAWPAWWWREGVTSFDGLDQVVNAANSVGFLGVAEGVLGTGSPWALTVGVVLATLTAVLLAVMAFRGSRSRLWERTAAAAAGCVLLSPHAMYYDAGLAALPLLLSAVCGTPAERAVAVGLWAIAFLHPLAPALGVTPVFASLAGAFVLALRVYVRGPRGSPSRDHVSSATAVRAG